MVKAPETTAQPNGHLKQDSGLAPIKESLSRLSELASSDLHTAQDSQENKISVVIAGHTNPAIYKASLVLQETTAQNVLELLGKPEQWDTWKPEVRVVEELGDQFAHVHVTYSGVEKARRPRDLSLLEGVQHVQDGSILYAATSIESSRVPVSDKHLRGRMNLSGWVIQPVSEGNVKLTHYLQLDSAHFLSRNLPQKYLAMHIAANLAAIQNCITPNIRNSLYSSPSGSKSRRSLLSFKLRRKSRHRSTTGSTFDLASTHMSLGPSREGSINSVVENSVDESGVTSPDDTFNFSEKSAHQPNGHVNGHVNGVIYEQEEGVVSKGKLDGLPVAAGAAAVGAAAGAGVLATANGSHAPKTAASNRPSYPPHPDVASEASLAKKKQFDELLKQSGQWKSVLDQSGNRIFVAPGKDTLMQTRTDCTIDRTDLTSEQVLGALVNPIWRKYFDSRFLKEEIAPGAGAENPVNVLEAVAGIFPHIPDNQLKVERAVFRSQPGVSNPVITLIYHSEADSKYGELRMSGYHIQPNRDRTIQVKHIYQYLPPSKSVPAHVAKACAVLTAQKVLKLRSLVVKQGCPPTFVRQDGSFHISRWLSKDGTNVFTLQLEPGKISEGKLAKNWLIYDAHMFPAGLAIDSDDGLIKSVANVKQFEGLLEIVFEENPKGDMRISSGKESFPHVAFNGKEVTENVDAPTIGGGAPADEQPEDAEEEQQHLTNGDLAEGVAGGAAAGAAAAVGAKALSNHIDQNTKLPVTDHEPLITQSASQQRDKSVREAKEVQKEEPATTAEQVVQEVKQAVLVVEDKFEVMTKYWKDAAAVALLPPQAFVTLFMCLFFFLIGRYV